MASVASGSPSRLESKAYGSEKIMQCWINGPDTDGIDDKIIMAKILLKTNIPSFHHSIIPFPGKIWKRHKTYIFLVSGRNFEAFNYGYF